MTEAALYPWLVRAMFVAAAVTAASVLVVTAPYGRHARPGWGPTVSARVGWLLMELPASVGFAAIYAAGRHAMEPGPLALLTLWQSHYVYRSLIYPLRMGASARRMPLAIAAMGATFNGFNAYLNARQVSEMGAYPVAWLSDPRFLGGIALFAVGWGINQASDATLRGLRRPGESGYRVPMGGLYRWVSCPNYLGEIGEWFGWALATYSLAGLGFALYTLANLGPRALANHRWYRETFPDYPPERRALIPFVL